MDLEELVDKYRQSPAKRRYTLVFLLSLLPGAYYWVEEGDSLQKRFEEVKDGRDVAKNRLEANKRQLESLPGLLSRVEDIEKELEAAQKLLPDQINIDEVLGSLGGLEAESDVKLQKFVPGVAVQPNQEIDYEELPVQLEVRGKFSDVMAYYDKILQLPSFTHIRSLSFDREEQREAFGAQGEKENKEQLVLSRSRLILFKGTNF